MRTLKAVLVLALFLSSSSAAFSDVLPGGKADDNNISVGYVAKTGAVFVDAGGKELERIAILSESGVFSGDPSPRELCLAPFCNDNDFRIEHGGFGNSFGDVSFGNVAESRLTEELLLRDLTVQGRLFPNGGFGAEVDLIYLAFVPFPGDTNGDGVVDMDDLNNVRNHFGATGPDDGKLAGDAYPFDGVVNTDDLNNVRNHFGASAIAIPEPSAVMLTVLGALAVITGSRRGRSGGSHDARKRC